jgi:AraC-like DNA-binding protein
MPVGSSISGLPVAAGEPVPVWDTQYAPSSRAFDLYREIVCRLYMHWSPEVGDGDFHARIETTKVGSGSVTRHRSSPHSAIRTARDIADSPGECAYLVRVISGQLHCEQGESLTVARPGELLLLGSSRPTKATMHGSYDALVVTIPKDDLAEPAGTTLPRCCTLLNHNRTPLAGCLSLAADLMPRASSDEIAALYHAVRSLIPVEAGSFASDEGADTRSANINYLMRGILAYIDQNVANFELTPKQVADQFGISVRYVHKLFIGCGMTFHAYATAKRLDYICKDLVSTASRRQPISDVAFRWGFNDLSSFNRAFKKRYGCTPTQFRMRAGR